MIPIELPPLRERREDIPLLVEHFLRKLAQPAAAARFDASSPPPHERLAAYAWPGNVRELENAIERAVVLAAEPVIARRLLPTMGTPAAGEPGESGAVLPGLKLHANLEWVERDREARARAVRRRGRTPPRRWASASAR